MNIEPEQRIAPLLLALGLASFAAIAPVSAQSVAHVPRACPRVPSTLSIGAACRPAGSSCVTRDARTGATVYYTCASFCGQRPAWCRQPCNGPPCASDMRRHAP